MGRANRRRRRRQQRAAAALERAAYEAQVERMLVSELVAMGCRCPYPPQGKVTRSADGRQAVARIHHQPGCPVPAKTRATSN